MKTTNVVPVPSRNYIRFHSDSKVPYKLSAFASPCVEGGDNDGHHRGLDVTAERICGDMPDDAVTRIRFANYWRWH